MKTRSQQGSRQPVRRSTRRSQPLPPQEQPPQQHEQQQQSSHEQKLQSSHEQKQQSSHEQIYFAPQSNPLSIPEVLLVVARNLDRRTLAVSCLQVSKQWHTTLSTLLWETVDLQLSCQPSKNAETTSIPASVLAKHAHLIRSLNLSVYDTVNLPDGTRLSLPNLTILNIHRSSGTCEPDDDDIDSDYPWDAHYDSDDDDDDDDDDEDEDEETNHSRYPVRKKTKKISPRKQVLNARASLTEFVKQHHPTLQDVTLNRFTPNDLLDALASCPNLQRLDLEGMNLLCSPDDWLVRYDTLWSRLKSLSLSGPWFYDLTGEGDFDIDMADKIFARLKNARPTLLQELRLDTDDLDMMCLQIPTFLIEKSPQLRELSWITGRNCSDGRGDGNHLRSYSRFERDEMDWDDLEHMVEVAMAWLAHMTKNNRLPHTIESLALPEEPFAAKDLKLLLGYLPSLTKLDLHWTNFSESSWKVLFQDHPRYLTDLTELKLTDCHQLKTSLIHTMLCSLSGLEVFEADVFKMDEVQRLTTLPKRGYQPWACLRLRALSMAILCLNKDQEAAIFDQLATLSKLRDLNLSMDYLYRPPMRLNGVEISYARKKAVEFFASSRPSVAGSSGNLQKLSMLRQLRNLTGTGVQDAPVCTEQDAQWILMNWPRLETLSGITIHTKAELVFKNHPSSRVDLRDCTVSDVPIKETYASLLAFANKKKSSSASTSRKSKSAISAATMASDWSSDDEMYGGGYSYSSFWR
ncbi:hypothetical protein BGZ83_008457 [Gryganskiella cystojenkinii]|nr:hypothetical protein BGZ83_008457 [Gryganskiella cystojenkinii]